MDLVDMYDKTTAWTHGKIAGAADKLDSSSPCEEWKVRDLVNHCLAGQAMFEAAAQGTPPAGPPSGMPEDIVGSDPAGEYEAARQKTLKAFRAEGGAETAGMMLGIGFVDQLIHGWDIATATGQDATMPDGLAENAFGLINGMMDDPEARGGVFKPRIDVPDDAPAQTKLLAYSGRQA